MVEFFGVSSSRIVNFLADAEKKGFFISTKGGEGYAAQGLACLNAGKAIYEAGPLNLFDSFFDLQGLRSAPKPRHGCLQAGAHPFNGQS